MQKFLMALVVMAAAFGVMAMPADAAYKFGASAGASIVVGGNGGDADTADLAGDIVASYTSTANNDTKFKTNTGSNPTTVVSAVYGDSAMAIGGSTLNIAPGDTANFTMSITNWSNSSDTIKVRIDTAANVTGASKDSITIKVNNQVIYQNGVETYPPVLVVLAPGADTTVNVTIIAANSALGAAISTIKATPNNGGGGDTGGYFGNNGDTYCGDGNASVSFTVNVILINVLISAQHDLISTPASYNGPAADTIPGATLTYIIRYDNDGNDTAVNFMLNVKIPANTVLADTGISGSSTHTGCTVTSTITDDTGTTVAYTAATASRIRWTFAGGGVAPNNGDAVGVVDAITSDFDAGIMKFKVYVK